MRKLMLGLLLAAATGCSDSALLPFISGLNFGAVATQVNMVTPGSGSDNPDICCDGLNVYTVYQSGRNGPNDIFFNSSGDGGLTWQANDTRVDTDAPGAAPSNKPKICCSGQRLYVVWEDDRNDATTVNDDIYFNYSTDGGVTWQASDIRLDTDAPGSGDSENPQICCDGLNVSVIWEDRRDGEVDVYFNYSSDGGATWQASDIRLDTDAAGVGPSESLSICCSGLNVYVSWEDHRNGNGDVYFNYSTNGGATWQANDIRIDVGDTPGSTTADEPEICCDGQRVYIVWRDNRNEVNTPPPNRDIVINYSLDGGANWQPSPIVVDTGNLDSNDPVVSCEGLNVYVAWRDNRDGEDDTYFSSSRDGGATWQATDTRLDTGDAPGAARSHRQQICCAGSNVYVVWEDSRAGTSDDIFVNVSTNGGVTWRSTDLRIDGGDANGASSSDRPAICCDMSYVYVAWRDGRNAQQDIFFNGSR